MALATVLALALAIGESAVPQDLLDVTDSAGVRITTSDAVEPDAGTVCLLAEAPDVRVVSPTSGEWTLFQIEDLDRMDDGRLVVVNRGSRELLVFGRDGEFLQSIGRRGEGPGEFMDPIEVDFFAGESIVVWDWDLGRLALFGPGGVHERNIRLRPPVPNPTGHIGVLGREGIVLGSQDWRPSGAELTPQFLDILLYDWDGRRVDKLATLPYGATGRVEGTSTWVGRPLFQARGVFSIQGELLYTSDGSSPEVRIHRGDRLESIIRWRPGDLTVQREHVETYRAAYLKDLDDRAGDLAPILRRRLDSFPPMDTFPAVTEIRTDAQGRIWVRTFERPGSTATAWLGFADTGAFICSLSVPNDLTVLHFESSAVVAVHRDEMDIESVEIRSLDVPEG